VRVVPDFAKYLGDLGRTQSFLNYGNFALLGGSKFRDRRCGFDFTHDLRLLLAPDKYLE
jgi:hypothetical protein